VGIDTTISHLSGMTSIRQAHVGWLCSFHRKLSRRSSFIFLDAQEQLLGQSRRTQGYNKQQDSPFKANYNKLTTLKDTNGMLSVLFACNAIFTSTLLLLLGILSKILHRIT
jgi:hypothetical protein